MNIAIRNRLEMQCNRRSNTLRYSLKGMGLSADGTLENSVKSDAEGAMRKQISQAKGQSLQFCFISRFWGE